MPSVGDPEQGFSGRRAAEVVGISYRQLDYWARTDLIRPTLADAAGSGSRRLYSYRDLLELKVVKNLLDAGIRLESVREAFSYLRDNLEQEYKAEIGKKLEDAAAVGRAAPEQRVQLAERRTGREGISAQEQTMQAPLDAL